MFCCKNTLNSSVSRKRATAATTTTKITMLTVNCIYDLQWIRQVLRMFGTELIQIDKLIKTAQSAAASAAKFWKHKISTASQRAFPGFLAIFWLLNSLHEVFDTQEFTRFLSTVSSQRRTTRSEVFFQSSNRVIWVLLVSMVIMVHVLCFGIETVLCGLYLENFDLTLGLLNYCLVYIVAWRSLSIRVRIIFTTNVLVDRIKNLTWNASPND